MGSEQNPLTSSPPEEDRRSTSEIKGDIRRTRDRLDDTLEILNERLSPRSLINDFLSWFESGAHRTGSESGVLLRRGYGNVARQIRENPIPALFIGAGITWMILKPESDESSDSDARNAYGTDDLSPGSARTGGAESVSSEKRGVGSAMRETVGEAKEALSGAKEVITEKVSGIGSGVQATASSAGTAIGEGIRRSRLLGSNATQHFQKGYTYAGDRFQQAVEEYPLGVALGFLGVGVLTGLLFPRTRQEDKLIGQRSDQLIERAKEAGKETLEKTKAVAERVAERTIEEAKRQGITPEAAGGKVSEVVDKVGAIAAQAKEEAIHAAEEEGLKPNLEKKEEPEKTSKDANS
jgi:hypothetical protein